MSIPILFIFVINAVLSCAPPGFVPSQDPSECLFVSNIPDHFSFHLVLVPR